MMSERRTYTSEFRIEAVRLVTEQRCGRKSGCFPEYSANLEKTAGK